jgi:hypothetical protein
VTKLGVFVACVVFCLLLGCGKAGARKYRTQGAVSVDGVAAAAGVIRFEPVENGDLPGGGVIVAGHYEAWLTPGPKVVRLAVEGDRTGLKPTDLSPNIVPRKYLDDPPRIDIPSSGDLDFHITAGVAE